MKKKEKFKAFLHIFEHVRATIVNQNEPRWRQKKESTVKFQFPSSSRVHTTVHLTPRQGRLGSGGGGADKLIALHAFHAHADSTNRKAVRDSLTTTNRQPRSRPSLLLLPRPFRLHLGTHSLAVSASFTHTAPMYNSQTETIFFSNWNQLKMFDQRRRRFSFYYKFLLCYFTL